MSTNKDYFLKNDTYKEQIRNLLKKSTPVEVESLNFTGFVNGHSHGIYDFYLKNTKNKRIVIPFRDELSNINDFWPFLEFLTSTNETSLLYIDDDGNEQILYVEHINEQNIRFFIAETWNVYDKFQKHEIEHYTYEDADVLLDVIINKKVMIKQFYEQLLKMFDGWEKETDFAPWATDVNEWQKDSEILKNYYKSN